MNKKVRKVMFALDDRTIKAIRLLAEDETNGNMSAVVRIAVREAAKSRGLWAKVIQPDEQFAVTSS